jgi:hypothetical protein
MPISLFTFNGAHPSFNRLKKSAILPGWKRPEGEEWVNPIYTIYILYTIYIKSHAAVHLKGLLLGFILCGLVRYKWIWLSYYLQAISNCKQSQGFREVLDGLWIQTNWEIYEISNPILTSCGFYQIHMLMLNIQLCHFVHRHERKVLETDSELSSPRGSSHASFLLSTPILSWVITV